MSSHALGAISLILAISVLAYAAFAVSVGRLLRARTPPATPYPTPSLDDGSVLRAAEREGAAPAALFPGVSSLTSPPLATAEAAFAEIAR